MAAIPSWLADFDLGEYLGIGLDSQQIGYLAGSLFLALLGLSAARRAKRATGFASAIWIAVAIGLFAGAFHVSVRGFADLVPEWLRPWAEPDRLARAAAIAGLGVCSLVLLSAHWVTGSMARFAHRVGGLAMAGVAVWLATGWFADEIPGEVREWTARIVIVRIGIVAGLIALGAAFWTRQAEGTPHVRWLNRVVTPPAFAISVLLALKWFGSRVLPDVPIAEVESMAYIVGAICTGTCLLIAGGAYLMRERPRFAKPVREARRPAIPTAIVRAPSLPVAVMLDDRGHPILPTHNHHAGSAGA